MGRVAIVTDSTAELPISLADELEITVVPWQVGVGSDTLVDGPELCTPRFYRDAVKKHVEPAASPPRAQDFAVAYANVAAESDEIVSIHASAELSSTVQAARHGSMAFLGRCNIHVVDSMFMSRALGLLVTRAAQAALAGLRSDEIVRHVNSLIPRTYLAFHVDSLEHLERNGLYRNSRDEETGLARSLLMFEEGQVVPLRRSRNRGTPIERLVQFIGEFDELEELAILHSGVSPGLSYMRTCLGECMPARAVEEHCYGPVFASRIGPKAIGVVAFEAATF